MIGGSVFYWKKSICWSLPSHTGSLGRYTYRASLHEEGSPISFLYGWLGLANKHRVRFPVLFDKRGNGEPGHAGKRPLGFLCMIDGGLK